jgi:hypothetical protein
MKKFFALILFISHTIIALAQGPDPISTGKLSLASSDEAFRFVNPYDGRFKEMIGQPFYYDSLYHEGELKTNKGVYTAPTKFRFDQVQRAIQAKLADGKELLISEKDMVYCKIIIEDKPSVFVAAHLPNGRKLTVVQAIYHSSRMQLLRDTRKYMYRVKSDNLDGYSSEKVYDEVRKDYRYYLRKGDTGDFKEVKLTAKSFGQVLDKHSELTQLFKAGTKKGGLTVSKLNEIMTAVDKEVKN